MDMKLEVVVVPVAEVDKAKDINQALGWRLDADFVTGPDWPDWYAQSMADKRTGQDAGA